jgi:hypothetical protein
VDYETLNDEILAVSDRLEDADEATVAAETERLRGLAAQLPDEFSRLRATAQIDRLPELIWGPPAGTSEEYTRATNLVASALHAEGTPAERIALADRVATEVAELAAAAPREESGTILRMNSSIARLIEELRQASPES